MSVFWKQKPQAHPSLQEQFDRAKERFDIIRRKLAESSLSEEDKQDALNVNEAEYRKILERLICLT